ncbi:Uncharacterized protein OBRU01_02526 [Operophtera brumata]|uniref:DM13 domain-containing protein n=1 Tax=Operophtera brumata TaxID=104452 RepID=A0A0L7LQR7_OPEBR|nr:Uncharacterized protein OBRU01_02526 [Operophtera brumata]
MYASHTAGIFHRLGLVSKSRGFSDLSLEIVNETIRLLTPGIVIQALREFDFSSELTVFDIGHFAVWCEAFTVNFGHVTLPGAALSNIPPSLKMLGVSPQVRYPLYRHSLEIINYNYRMIMQIMMMQSLKSLAAAQHDYEPLK